MTPNEPDPATAYLRELVWICADLVAGLRAFGDPPPAALLDDAIDQLAQRTRYPELRARDMRLICEAILGPVRKTN